MDSILLDENSARQYLDRRLQENDVKGAIEFAINGQKRFPKLKRLLRFLSNIVVQDSTEGEEIDWYTVLGVDDWADIKTIKQHYVKLATGNKLGSLEVHKLLNKAWDTLSNKFTRSDYDLRRRSRQIQQNAFVVKEASSTTQSLQPPPVENILMEMARTVIIQKLNECNCADNNEHNPPDNIDSIDEPSTEGLEEEGLKTMEVPDSDFHDFDSERTKESFGDNQVWAVYDDDDGMPRLYSLIRKASKRSSKLQVSWLNSDSNLEPESIQWIESGFHKTCGDFCVEKEEISIELNSFSHRVAGCMKAPNVFQIFPKKGDVWALYRNWSPEWNKHTTEEEKHKYEMVEVLSDYDEDNGVTIVPLVKVSGFKAVFCQHSDARKVRTVPKEEIFRFSHQVSSYLLTEQEAPNVPKGHKELDPAAMPLELLLVSDVNGELGSELTKKVQESNSKTKELKLGYVNQNEQSSDRLMDQDMELMDTDELLLELDKYERSLEIQRNQ